MKQFSFFSTIASGGVNVTLEIFQNAIRDPRVSALCAQIAELAAKLKTVESDAERKAIPTQMGALKRRLPAFCWHASFPDGHRGNDGAVPSGLIMIDVDHIDEPRQVFESIRAKALSMGLVAAHVTPSTMGLRLVFVIPNGMTLVEAQSFFARELGLKVDNCAKDLARLSFLVPEGYWLYVDEDVLFGDGEVGSLGFLGSLGSLGLLGEKSKEKLQDGACSVSTRQGCSDAVTYEAEYEGVSYEAIVTELCKLMGGEPAHGARNNFIFQMACHLRGICDGDAEWISRVMPTYGEDERRWRNTIDSACRNAKSHSMSAMMRRAIEVAKRADRMSQGTNEDGACSVSTQQGCNAEMPPEMPERLPSLVRLLVKNVPEVCRPSLANGIFPPLATNMTDVTFRILDNTIKEPTFMCVNIAEMSSGKSCINRVVPFIMSEIRKSDDESRRREQEWKETNQQKGANRDKLKRPEGLCVQMLSPDMTNAALVQKLIDANGKYVYTNMDELDLLQSLQTNGTRDVGKIICLAFDNGEYGQERVGAQSVTGKVAMRWNWNASTTIDRGRKFFRNRLIDGTLSRINFCTIIKDYSKDFGYADFNEHFEAELKPYIENLRKERGLISCPKALALAKRLQKKLLMRSDLTDDEVYRSLTYRAVTIAYMKAMVLYVAQGNRWSKEIETFVEWSLEYDMWCKMHFFGDEFHQTVSREKVGNKPGPKNLLAQMPASFNYETGFAVYKSTGKTDGNAFRNLLYRWVNRGYIRLDKATGVYTKTAEYLAAHEV